MLEELFLSDSRTKKLNDIYQRHLHGSATVRVDLAQIGGENILDFWYLIDKDYLKLLELNISEIKVRLSAKGIEYLQR
ncbi:hypothetical protein [Cohnella sp. JJ-181]|uniref:hypothetical protein n=1 Tax=Cohnella rhizoplanae TaxID=2974897 RepID=UPI0022FFA2AF|nr:hypothetical protein [Cohnella sp. JJ-181]CAI6087192.1 hypothetical protein COHCIP112018_05383 [Cohnella sp. JJ-181]